MPIAAKIASSSVGGSRRTRRRPYFVFQSSLIGASCLILKYLGGLMLHCNMKLVWQSSYALIDLKIFQSGGVVNLDRRGCGGDRLQRSDEIARGGDREMRQ